MHAQDEVKQQVKKEGLAVFEILARSTWHPHLRRLRGCVFASTRVIAHCVTHWLVSVVRYNGLLHPRIPRSL